MMNSAPEKDEGLTKGAVVEKEGNTDPAVISTRSTTYEDYQFNKDNFQQIDAIRKLEGIEFANVAINELLSHYAKNGIAREFKLNGRILVSGSNWLNLNDLDKAESVAFKKLMKVLGISDFYIIQKSNVIGFPILVDLEDVRAISTKPSFVSYMDIFRNQIHESDNLKVSYLARIDQITNEIEIISKESVITAIRNDYEFNSDSVIRTYIAISDDDDYLVCSFFSDGTPVPLHDSYYEPRAELIDGVILPLTAEIKDFSNILNQKNFIQEIYMFEKGSDFLIPDKKIQKSLFSQLDSKSMKIKKKQRKYGAILILIAMVGGWLYSDYNSEAKIRERREQLHRSDLENKENERRENINHIEKFNKDENNNKIIYPTTKVLKRVIKTILLLPPTVSEGKVGDSWNLNDWNCISKQDYLIRFDNGINYECVITYKGNELSTSKLFEEWFNSLKTKWRNDKWVEKLNINEISLVDVITLNNDRTGILKFSFYVMPVPVHQEGNLITKNDIIRHYENLAERGRSMGYDFSFSREPLMASYLSNQKKAISLLKKENPTSTYWAFINKFSLKTELGALDIQLPFNSSLYQINGTNTSVTIKGATKYVGTL